MVSDYMLIMSLQHYTPVLAGIDKISLVFLESSESSDSLKILQIVSPYLTHSWNLNCKVLTTSDTRIGLDLELLCVSMETNST